MLWPPGWPKKGSASFCCDDQWLKQEVSVHADVMTNAWLARQQQNCQHCNILEHYNCDKSHDGTAYPAFPIYTASGDLNCITCSQQHQTDMGTGSGGFLCDWIQTLWWWGTLTESWACNGILDLAIGKGLTEEYLSQWET